MAKMRHIREPRKGSGSTNAPRGRDRSFKAALAEEYGVTEVPRRLQRRTMKTLEELPDTLPVRQRPVLWAVKSAATVMAVLAVTFAALMGLNTTHPQLTEALPGLGSVFAAMNGHDARDPSPTPAPTPTPQPEFQPETLENYGNFPGSLTVEDAWSDGRHTLILELSVSPYEGKNLSDLVDQSPGGTPYDYVTLYPAVILTNDFGEIYPKYTGVLTVSSNGDYRDFKGSFEAFQPDGTGKLTAHWQLDLDGMAVGPELSVSMSLPHLCAFYSLYDNSGSLSWDAGFEAEFTVPVAEGVNRMFSAQYADGPVTLTAVDYSPSHVELDVSVPYLGMIGDLFSAMSDSPLGVYARLTCMNGSYEYETDGPDGEWLDVGKLVPDGSARLDLHYVFKSPSPWNGVHPRDLKGPLTLTIYELPQQKEHIGRVLAEFTIDMSTGRAYPGENYIKDGYEKGDAQKTTAQRLEEVSYDGLLMLFNENDGDNISSGQFTVSAPFSSMGRELTVNCYLEDEIVYDFTFVLGSGYFEGEYGWYSTGTHYLPSTGQEYIATTVSVGYPDWLFEQYGGDGSFDRLELTDAASGEVLIPNMKAAWWETIEQLLGANPYKYEFGSQELGDYDS